MRTRARSYSFCCLFLFSSTLLALAFQAQSFAPVRAAPTLGPAETMVVDVDVVNVFFNVRSHDRLVRELSPDEFKLFEDDRPQAIRYFSAESQQPLTLAILLDSSSSQIKVLNKQLAVGKRFLQQVLTQPDEAMVLGFDSHLQIQQDFTHSLDNVIAALTRGLQGTTGETELESSSPPKDRTTALYDGIVAVSKERMQRRDGHKAMLILTDGQDMGSRYSAKQAIEAATRADTICYVLLIGDKNEMASSEYKGVERMRELTNETGGRMVMVGNDPKKLERSFNEISDELRHFYSLAYTPDRKDKKGEYRRISLKSKHRYKLQARKGYFATPREKKADLQASAR